MGIGRERGRPPRTIREWREARYMYQPEFAAVLGVKLRTLRAWEQGQQEPRLHTKLEVAARLGVDPEQIDWKRPVHAKKLAA